MPEHALDLFPKEIWIKIVKDCNNPVPAALSRPPRSELYQTRLAVLSRACKLFQTLCLPLLYKSVVTANLTRFLSPIHTASRREAFALIEHLYVEYPEDGQVEPPVALLGHRQQITVAPRGKRAARALDVEHVGSLAQRVRSISSALETHLKCEAPRGSQPSTLFPRLKTVAVCSIYGRHSDKWGEDAEHHSDLVQCRLLCARFLSVHRVGHCCYRDVNGPLGLPDMEDELYNPKKYYSSPILHIGRSFDRTELRTPPGVPFRWVADMTAGKSWEELFRLLASEVFIRGRKRNRMDTLVAQRAASEFRRQGNRGETQAKHGQTGETQAKGIIFPCVSGRGKIKNGPIRI